MNIRRAIVAASAVGALLAPNAALADVHATINVKHVKRDGVTKLKFSGDLHLVSGSESCTRNRKVAIQRRKNSGAPWKVLAKTSTNNKGHYAKVTGHKQGQFRLRVPKDGTCTAATSGMIAHKH